MTRRRRLGLPELLFALVLSGAILMTGLGGLVMGARARATAQTTQWLENEATHAATVWLAHHKTGRLEGAPGWTRELSANEGRRVACDADAQVTLRFDADAGVLWRTYRCGARNGTPHRVAAHLSAIQNTPDGVVVTAAVTSPRPVQVKVRLP